LQNRVPKGCPRHTFTVLRMYRLATIMVNGWPQKPTIHFITDRQTDDVTIAHHTAWQYKYDRQKSDYYDLS